MEDETPHILESVKVEAPEVEDTPNYEKHQLYQRAIKHRAARATLEDCDYYLVVIFQTKVQRDEFASGMKWEGITVKAWVDGLKAARQQGIKLSEINPDELTNILTRRRAKHFKQLSDAEKKGLKFFPC